MLGRLSTENNGIFHIVRPESDRIKEMDIFLTLLLKTVTFDTINKSIPIGNINLTAIHNMDLHNCI